MSIKRFGYFDFDELRAMEGLLKKQKEGFVNTWFEGSTPAEIKRFITRYNKAFEDELVAKYRIEDGIPAVMSKEYNICDELLVYRVCYTDIHGDYNVLYEGLTKSQAKSIERHLDKQTVRKYRATKCEIYLDYWYYIENDTEEEV